MKPSVLPPFPGPIPAPLVGCVWVIICGVADWKTGPELAVSAFYIPGIVLTAWWTGRRPSLLVAFLAAVIWLISEKMGEKPYSQDFIPYWNGLTRLSVFAVTALLTSEIRIRRQTEAALRHQKEILSSVLNSMRDAVIVADEDGEIIVTNPAASSLFGPVAPGDDADAWVTKMEETLLESPPSEAGSTHPLRTAITGEQPEGIEISLRKMNSDEKTQLGMTVQPLLGKKVEDGGVVLVFNDLTARRNLEHQISQASEREQRRIGQDLHDGICQHLVGVVFAAGVLQGELEDRELPEQAAGAAEIALLIRQGIKQAKDLARGIYPVGIDERLDSALALLASTTQERTGIPCEYRQTGKEFLINGPSAGHLYRISQEAISNAAAHAKPRDIEIHANYLQDALILDITDSGTGLASATQGQGIGRQIMNYRANLIGAKLEIQSPEGKGTRIRVIAALSAIQP